jgi:hypothetical protein
MRFRGSVPIPEAEIGHRCESCSHPMSEGTWEDGPRREWTAEDADLAELAGVPSGSGPRVHYSPCDEGCDHGGPARLRLEQRGEKGWIPVTDQRPGDALLLDRVDAVEASWRSVDIRTLGWPHDLRPEKLAVLCLRCFAERSSA